ncbi:MAG: patatin [Pirellulaceae bacterium]|nr:patatin [Pirellulaceae bacterium]
MVESSDTSAYSLGLMLGGGGARAAYQVGVLQAIARQHPQLRIPILTGVSAGAINIAHLASFEGELSASVDVLTKLWGDLKLENVFRTGGCSLLWRAMKVGMKLSVGLPPFFGPVHGMVDTEPLREYLHGALKTSDGVLLGIDQNIASGRIQGVALTANSYETGSTVVFFRGHEIEAWERPNRKSIETRLTVEHIMASSALPLLFPPIRVGDRWYGDGGVRLSAPLGPAVHMGADRLLVISTHFRGATAAPASMPEPPSPATVLAAMYNALFLDQLDQDVHQMNRTNHLVQHVSEEHRHGLREVDLLVLQPSEDIGAIAFELKDHVPPTFRYLLNRLGSGQSSSEDLLSTMLFHPDYIHRLIEIGQRDGQRQADRIAQFLA